MAGASFRVLGIVAGVAAGLAGLYFLLLSDDKPADDSSKGAANSSAKVLRSASERQASPGVKSTPADPANYIAAEQTTNPERRDEFMLEADRSEDLLAAVKGGETHWQPTLIEMDFSERANETYLECSRKYLLQPCPYDIEYVIEVKEPGKGEIVFGRVVMEKVYSDDCEQYVRCTVKGNVGGTVPVDPEVSGIFSRRKSQIDNYDELTYEQLKEMLDIMEKGIAMMEEQGPDGQLDWEYRLELERSYLYLIKARMAQVAK